MIIAFGVAAALGLYWFVTRTRAGVLVRAGASNRQMATLMGVRVPLLFLGVFALGAMLAAVAGALLGPITSVQVGMGEEILILVLVCIVIGGIGSIRAPLSAPCWWAWWTRRAGPSCPCCCARCSRPPWRPAWGPRWRPSPSMC